MYFIIVCIDSRTVWSTNASQTYDYLYGWIYNYVQNYIGLKVDDLVCPIFKRDHDSIFLKIFLKFVTYL